MVNVVYSQDSLTVLGGPEQLEVDLNIGATGTRGGIFFTGNKLPNNMQDSEFATTPQLFDFYILTDPASSNFLKVYQYQAIGVSNSWVESFSLNTSNYFVNKVVSFSSGSASLEIDVTEVGIGQASFTENANSFAYFNVQATISNINSESAPDGTLDHNPVAFSLQVGDVTEDLSGQTEDDKFPLLLPVTIEAVEFSGGTWQALDNKDVIVYFAINYVNPNEIIANLTGGGS